MLQARSNIVVGRYQITEPEPQPEPDKLEPGLEPELEPEPSAEVPIDLHSLPMQPM